MWGGCQARPASHKGALQRNVWQLAHCAVLEDCSAASSAVIGATCVLMCGSELMLEKHINSIVNVRSCSAMQWPELEQFVFRNLFSPPSCMERIHQQQNTCLSLCSLTVVGLVAGCSVEAVHFVCQTPVP